MEEFARKMGAILVTDVIISNRVWDACTKVCVLLVTEDAENRNPQKIRVSLS